MAHFAPIMYIPQTLCNILLHFVSHPPLPAHSPLTKCELFAHFVALRAHSAVWSRAGLSQSIRDAAHGRVETAPRCAPIAARHVIPARPSLYGSQAG